MEKFEELKALVTSLEEDLYKFHFRLNGAAGVRVRKAMQQVRVLAQEIRMDILEIQKNR